MGCKLMLVWKFAIAERDPDFLFQIWIPRQDLISPVFLHSEGF